VSIDVIIDKKCATMMAAGFMAAIMAQFIRAGSIFRAFWGPFS